MPTHGRGATNRNGWLGVLLIAAVEAEAAPPEASPPARADLRWVAFCKGDQRTISFAHEVSEMEVVSADPAVVRTEVLEGLFGRLRGVEEGEARVTVTVRVPQHDPDGRRTVTAPLQVPVEDCAAKGHRPASALTGGEGALELDAAMQE